MSTGWKGNEPATFYLLGIQEAIADTSVANLYHNQPLQNLIRTYLNINEFQTNLTTMLTQTGYATRLLFIIQLANPASVFGLCPEAYNRLNTVFITTYFIDSLLGSFLAGIFWQLASWLGVIAVGLCRLTTSLLCNIFSNE